MSKNAATARRCLNALGYGMHRRKNVLALAWLALPLRPIKTIVDVNANRWQLALRALAAFPGAVLHCYESPSGPYAKLQEVDVAISTLDDEFPPSPTSDGCLKLVSAGLVYTGNFGQARHTPVTAKRLSLMLSSCGYPVFGKETA